MIKGQEVIYLAPAPKPGAQPSARKGTIVEVLVEPSATTTGVARIDHSGDDEFIDRSDRKDATAPSEPHTHVAIATYDPSGKAENSFRLLDDKVEASTKRQPAAAAPAINGSSK